MDEHLVPGLHINQNKSNNNGNGGRKPAPAPRKQQNKNVAMRKTKSVQQPIRHSIQKIRPALRPTHEHLRNIGLARPSRHLLAAVIDPFNLEVASGVKVPMGGTESQGVPVRAFFEVVIGATGCGYAIGLPNVSDRDAAQFTTSTYGGLANSGFVRADGATPGVGGIAAFKPYNAPALLKMAANGTRMEMECRLVCSGIRAKYSGTEMSRSGTVFALHTPENFDISNESPTYLMQNHKCIAKYNVGTHETYQVNWRGKSAIEQSFRDQASLSNSEQGVPDYPSVCGKYKLYYDWTQQRLASAGTAYGLLFVGCTPGTTFTCELVEHWEFIGPPVGLLHTPVHSDTNGLPHVEAIAARADVLHASMPHMSRTEHTANAIEDIALALEPGMAASATATFGPEAGAIVGAGFNLLKHARNPVNHIINDVATSTRRMFGL